MADDDEFRDSPLPRRSAQRHLEPQLRESGGGGNGTPFTPFTPAGEPSADEAERTATGSPGRSAEFLDGARRGRRGDA